MVPLRVISNLNILTGTTVVYKYEYKFISVLFEKTELNLFNLHTSFFLNEIFV